MSESVEIIPYLIAQGPDSLIGFARPFLVLLLHHSVAFAGSGLQPRPIDDIYVPTLISNQSGLLQYARSDGDAGPPCSQHMGQKLLRQRGQNWSRSGLGTSAASEPAAHPPHEADYRLPPGYPACPDICT